MKMHQRKQSFFLKIGDCVCSVNNLKVNSPEAFQMASEMLLNMDTLTFSIKRRSTRISDMAKKSSREESFATRKKYQIQVQNQQPLGMAIATENDMLVTEEFHKEATLDKKVVLGETTIQKYFPGNGTFTGVVMSFEDPYYKVAYEDGDEEEISWEELRQYLKTRRPPTDDLEDSITAQQAWDQFVDEEIERRYGLKKLELEDKAQVYRSSGGILELEEKTDCFGPS